MKVKYVTAVESDFLNNNDVAILVRGKNRFIVVNIDFFEQFREYELEKSVREAKEDIDLVVFY